MTRAQRPGLAAVLGMVSSFACTATAWGAELTSGVPVTVVAVRTDDAYTQAGALTKAVRNALKEVPGWTLGEGDFSLEVLTLGLKCNDIPDPACQARIADQIKSDRYIWGSLRTEGGNVKGELHLWVRGQSPSSAGVDYSANLTEPNDEALRKIAENAVAALTGGPPRGSLRVRTGATVGEVFVDGKSIGSLTNGDTTFDVPAGPHKILVKSAGYVDAEASTVVEPIGTSNVALSQLPVTVMPQINWRKFGGYAGIGAGVAFGTVAIISATQLSSIEDDEDFRKFAYLFPHSVENVCDPSAIDKSVAARTPGNEGLVARGKELCGRGDTLSALTYVFFPLAAISAGVGAYFVVTSGQGSDPSSSSPQTGWTVQPAVGFDHGRVNVTYRW